MRTVLYVIGAIVVAFVAWVVWRIGSVARGGRQRDQRLMRELAELAGRLQGGLAADPAEVMRLAEKPQLRLMLHALLAHHGRLDLFPQQQLGRRSEAEAVLAYWMMHPNELQDPPAEMQHLATEPRQVGGRAADFEVFRYRMGPGHWAGPEWILGLAGPFYAGDAPYSGSAAGWSVVSDTEGVATPGSVVDRYLGLAAAKGMLPGEDAPAGR